MIKKIAFTVLDILSGLVVFLLVDTFSRHVYFDLITCTVLTASLIFLAALILGGWRVLPTGIRAVLINLVPIAGIFIVDIPKGLFWPIPAAAILFTTLGLILRKTKGFGLKKLATVAIGYILLLLFLFLFYPNQISNQYTVKLNRPASEFTFITFEGDTLRSDDLKGKVILIDFWSSGCGSCVKAMPDLERLYVRYQNNPQVEIICANVGWSPMDKEKTAIEKYGFHLPFSYDTGNESETRLGFEGAGHLIMIDKQFNIRFQHLGYSNVENYVGSISKHIEALLSE